MTVIYEATRDRPHFCTTADDDLPVGSICRCDCGRFWLRKTVIGAWVSYWVPVRWYHRAARRRITEWKRQRRIRPIVQSIIAGEPQTLTNKTIQDYGVNLRADCGCDRFQFQPDEKESSD